MTISHEAGTVLRDTDHITTPNLHKARKEASVLPLH